jgi:hypothetical protein
MAKDETKQRARRVRVGNISDVQAAVRELARLYRAARREAGPSPAPGVALQLAKIIAEIRGCIETAFLEKRLKAGLATLEEFRNGKKPGGKMA